MIKYIFLSIFISIGFNLAAKAALPTYVYFENPDPSQYAIIWSYNFPNSNRADGPDRSIISPINITNSLNLNFYETAMWSFGYSTHWLAVYYYKLSGTNDSTLNLNNIVCGVMSDWGGPDQFPATPQGSNLSTIPRCNIETSKYDGYASKTYVSPPGSVPLEDETF